MGPPGKAPGPSGANRVYVAPLPLAGVVVPTSTAAPLPGPPPVFAPLPPFARTDISVTSPRPFQYFAATAHPFTAHVVLPLPVAQQLSTRVVTNHPMTVGQQVVSSGLLLTTQPDVGHRLCNVRPSINAARAVQEQLRVIRPKMAAALDLRVKRLGGEQRLQRLMAQSRVKSIAHPIFFFAALASVPAVVATPRAVATGKLARRVSVVVRRMERQYVARLKAHSKKSFMVSAPNHVMPRLDRAAIQSGALAATLHNISIDHSSAASRSDPATIKIPAAWKSVARAAFGDSPAYAEWATKAQYLLSRYGEEFLAGDAYLGAFPDEAPFLLLQLRTMNIDAPSLQRGDAVAAERTLRRFASRQIFAIKRTLVDAARARGVADDAIATPLFQNMAAVAASTVADVSSTLSIVEAFLGGYGSQSQREATADGESPSREIATPQLIAEVAAQIGCDADTLADAVARTQQRVRALWAANARGSLNKGDLWGLVPREQRPSDPAVRPLRALLALLCDPHSSEIENTQLRAGVVAALDRGNQIVSAMALLDEVARLRLTKEGLLTLFGQVAAYHERFGALVTDVDLFIPLRLLTRDHGKNGYGAKLELAYIETIATVGRTIASVPTDPAMHRRRCDFIVDGQIFVEIKSAAESDLAAWPNQIDRQVTSALGQFDQTAEDLPNGASYGREVVLVVPLDRQPLLQPILDPHTHLDGRDDPLMRLQQAFQDALVASRNARADLTVAFITFEKGRARIYNMTSVQPKAPTPLPLPAAANFAARFSRWMATVTGLRVAPSVG